METIKERLFELSRNAADTISGMNALFFERAMEVEQEIGSVPQLDGLLEDINVTMKRDYKGDGKPTGSNQYNCYGERNMFDNKDADIKEVGKALREVIKGFLLWASNLKDILDVKHKENYVSPLLLLAKDMRDERVELAKDSSMDDVLVFYTNIIYNIEEFDEWLEKSYAEEEGIKRMMSYIAMVTTVIMIQLIQGSEELKFTSIGDGEYTIDVAYWLNTIHRRDNLLSHDYADDIHFIRTLIASHNHVKMHDNSHRAEALLWKMIPFMEVMHYEIHQRVGLTDNERTELFRSATIIASKMYIDEISDTGCVLNGEHVGDMHGPYSATMLLVKENATGFDHIVDLFWERKSALMGYGLDRAHEKASAQTLLSILEIRDALRSEDARSTLGDDMDMIEEYITDAIISTLSTVLEHIKESIGMPKHVDSIVEKQIEDAVAVYDEKYNEGDTIIDEFVRDVPEYLLINLDNSEGNDVRNQTAVNATMDIVRHLKRDRVYISNNMREETWELLIYLITVARVVTLDNILKEYNLWLKDDLLSDTDLHEALFYDGLIRIQVVNPQDVKEYESTQGDTNE